jgi:hypothetical protein
MSDVARMRASDQDRNEAVLALSDHFAEGRLDQVEFDARMTAASEATYLHDLDPLFADLPRRGMARRPGSEGSQRPDQAARGWETAVQRRGPGMHRHRRGLPFPVAPLAFALVITLVVVFGFKALLFVFPAMWFAGGIARRRAYRQLLASGGPHRDAVRWR